MTLQAIEKERAKQRQAEAGKSAAPGRPAQKKDKEPVPEVSKGQTCDKVGQKVEVSGKTARRSAFAVKSYR